MVITKDITLLWCEKHHHWWITNCPDCMLGMNETDIEKDGIKLVVNWIRENSLPCPNNPDCAEYDIASWEAKLRKWGIK